MTPSTPRCDPGALPDGWLVIPYVEGPIADDTITCTVDNGQLETGLNQPCQVGSETVPVTLTSTVWLIIRSSQQIDVAHFPVGPFGNPDQGTFVAQPGQPLDQCQQRRLAGEDVEHPGEYARGGLVPGDQQEEHHGEELLVTQRVAVLGGVQQVAGEVVGRIRSSFARQVVEIVHELHPGEHDLLFGVDAPTQDRLGPCAEALLVGQRHSEHLGDDPHRDVAGVLLGGIDLATPTASEHSCLALQCNTCHMYTAEHEEGPPEVDAITGPAMGHPGSASFGTADLVGIDGIVHLAAMSNDPLSDIDEAVTHAINHRAAVDLADSARSAGVSRFVFASTCSVYGTQGDDLVDESIEITTGSTST